MSRYDALLERACAFAGLNGHDARLLRLGSNIVYRLAAPVVVRISRQGASLDNARRTVAVARWLETVDYPAVRVVDFDQPIVIDEHVITFWQAVSDDGDQYATVGEVAEALVKLHGLIAPDDLHLPTLTPFGNADKRIEVNEGYSGELFVMSNLPRTAARPHER